MINAEAEMLGASQPQRLLSGSRFYVGPGRQVVLFDAIFFVTDIRYISLHDSPDSFSQ